MPRELEFQHGHLFYEISYFFGEDSLSLFWLAHEFDLLLHLLKLICLGFHDWKIPQPLLRNSWLSLDCDLDNIIHLERILDACCLWTFLGVSILFTRYMQVRLSQR